MKVSELWLHEWVKPTLSREELCERLTLSGLEIESVTPVAIFFSHVVMGQVLDVKKHSEAERLTICEVDIGKSKTLTIVCGAKNVKAGIKVPVALEGATLPNQLKITTSQIRGVTSQGMLCSSTELGLSEESEGLLILPEEVPIGENIWEYLKLSDYIIDVSITPNRGDCLSIKGLSKEISALTETRQILPEIPRIPHNISDVISVMIKSPENCSRYAGRIIRNVKADATTPLWLQERLRRAGARSISPVVDIMNYVMYELGQPMHAFDLEKISGIIKVRLSQSNETLALLDGQTVNLTSETLVIADNEKPLAIAGVMGGLDSSVSLLTKNIFLESAYFNPESVARAVRQFNLTSESSYRFERGVDPELQMMALERATQLLLDIVGGEVGPVIEVAEEIHLPKPVVILLRAARIEKILGVKIPEPEVSDILARLGFVCEKNREGWRVTVPSTRCDISLEVDLIEEVMRVYGTDRGPVRPAIAQLRMITQPETQLTLNQLRYYLRDTGYQEIIAYTFVDKKLQELLNPGKEPKSLVNPITSDMAVMRTNLWPGLIKILIYNLNRQQNRARLFETGLRFIPHSNDYLQERVLSGLLYGSVFPEQWGIQTRKVDFFDLKGEIENILKLTLTPEEFTFKPTSHGALHPGQSAEIYRKDKYVGILGALHPSVIQTLDLKNSVFVFELNLESIETVRIPSYQETSKFPEIRRDIAIFIDYSIPVQKIRDIIKNTAGELLREVNLFDLYEEPNKEENRKSIALSLTLQHSSRTLVDEEVNDLIDRVVVALKQTFAAELRG